MKLSSWDLLKKLQTGTYIEISQTNFYNLYSSRTIIIGSKNLTFDTFIDNKEFGESANLLVTILSHYCCYCRSQN